MCKVQKWRGVRSERTMCRHSRGKDKKCMRVCVVRLVSRHSRGTSRSAIGDKRIALHDDQPGDFIHILQRSFCWLWVALTPTRPTVTAWGGLLQQSQWNHNSQGWERRMTKTPLPHPPHLLLPYRYVKKHPLAPAVFVLLLYVCVRCFTACFCCCLFVRTLRQVGGCPTRTHTSPLPHSRLQQGAGFIQNRRKKAKTDKKKSQTCHNRTEKKKTKRI